MSSSFSLPSGLLLTVGMDPSCIARFALFIAVLVFGAVILGKILKKLFNLPTIAGEIIGGIVLGPSLVNIAQWPLFAVDQTMTDYSSGLVFSIPSSDLYMVCITMVSAVLTVSYLLWIAGHETELGDIAHVGVTACIAGVLGAVLPIAFIGVALVYCLGWGLVQSLSVGLIFAATSVSIPVAMLFSYHKMHLKSSKATLGAAVIDDIIAVILLSLFFMICQMGFFASAPVAHTMHSHAPSLWRALSAMAGAFVVMFGVGALIIPPFIKALKEYHYGYLIPLAATLIMIAYFAFAELVGGLAGITGAYFAGLFHRMGDEDHTAQKVIAPFVNAILLPLFLVSIGLQINIRLLTLDDWAIVAFILVLAIFSKMGGCWIATAVGNRVSTGGNRWSVVETYLFGASMVARGEVGLVVSTILYGSRMLDERTYSIAVVAIVLTTVIAPIMLTIGFGWLEDCSDESDQRTYRKVIGALQVMNSVVLFELIKDYITHSAVHVMSVHLSDGLEVISLDNDDTKIMLCPDEGVIFEGNKKTIQGIIQGIKERALRDIGRIS
jgi:Kef-type K+ transport system membrane component KefB